MKIDFSVSNALTRTYLSQQNQAAVEKTHDRDSSNSSDEVTISEEAYSRLSEQPVSTSNEITPHDPLPGDPDKPGSSGGNP